MTPLALVLTGCFGAYPLVNEPPILVSINGLSVPTRNRDPLPLLELPTGGQDYPITVEVTDPEKDAVRVFFPALDGQIDFDPDGRSGVWHVPETFRPTTGLVVYLRDDRKDDEAASEYRLEFDLGDSGWFVPSDSGDSGDSGDTAPGGETAVDSGLADTVLSLDSGETGATADTGP